MARKNPADCGTVGPLTDVLRRLRTAPRLRQTAVFDPDRSWVALKSRTAAVSSVLRCAILPVGSTRHWAVKRREFITLLGGAAVWPLAARALQGKLPTIGFLGSGTAATQSQWTGAFVQRLRELGWSEGRDVAIEYRWAEGRNERAAKIAAEFVRLKVDVIVTYGTQSNPRGKAGDHDHPNRLRAAGRPGCHRPRSESGATGRQPHRPVEPSLRSWSQTCRNSARGCARSAPIGNYGQCRQSR